MKRKPKITRWARIRAYMLARLQEAATWRGFVMIATAFGYKAIAEHQEAIIFVGLLVAGLIGVFAPERKDRNGH